VPLFQRRRRIRPVADESSRAVSPVPFVGMVLIVSSFFLYAASGVVAPWWGITIMLVVWLAQFALCCAWWTRHPRRLVVIGITSYPLWFCLMVGGAWLFGWEA
jgi:hypothetical protein